jgi:hypothetical protein
VNAIGHACTVVATFETGGGSLTHVIKASEPVVSVLLGIVINGIIPNPFTALTLIPVTYGVAYASTLGDLNITTMSKEFTSKVAMMAMTSNFAFAMRSILRKNLPKGFQVRQLLVILYFFDFHDLLYCLCFFFYFFFIFFIFFYL